MKTARRLLAAGALLLVIASVGWLSLPKPPLLDGISFSRRVFDRSGTLLYVTLSEDDKYRVFTPLDKISPELIEATLAQEDRFFGRHPGINPVSLARATWHFCLGHAGRGGASTITMQLARLRFQIRSRTVAGKCLQMLRALELERHYSKQQLLDAYLNLAPYGGNIEGAGAASEIYFGKNVRRLTMHEAVALSVIPQSPSRRVLQPALRNSSLEAAQERLLRRMQTMRTVSRRSFRWRTSGGQCWPRISRLRSCASLTSARFIPRSISISSAWSSIASRITSAPTAGVACTTPPRC